MAAKRPLTTPAEVLALCDAALEQSSPDAAPVAAFDADHTIWHADIGDLGWHACLTDRLFRPAAIPAIARELELVGARSVGEPHEDARRLYALYKEDKVTEDAIVRVMTACYAGWRDAEVTALARKLADSVLSKARYAGIAEVARGLKDRGLRVVVVSGSPGWFVREGVRGVMPLDPEVDVFGTDVARDGAVLGIEMRQPVTFFEGKVAALSLAFPGKRPSFAFGDSKGDIPLLHHAARRAFAVNCRPQLRKLALENDKFSLFDPPRTVSGQLVRAPGTDRVIE